MLLQLLFRYKRVYIINYVRMFTLETITLQFACDLYSDVNSKTFFNKCNRISQILTFRFLSLDITLALHNLVYLIKATSF